jgi:hypothetical protein
MNHHPQAAGSGPTIPPKPVPPPNIELRPGVRIPMPKPIPDYGQIRKP